MQDKEHARWTFDRTISANTLLSLVTVVGAVFSSYFALRADVTVVDGKVTALTHRLDYEQSGDRRLFDDIRQSLRRIEDQLGGKQDKPGR